MAKRRRHSRSSKQLPQAAEIVGFTAVEEAFFRAGEDEARVAEVDEAPMQRPSFWRRLFALSA